MSETNGLNIVNIRLVKEKNVFPDRKIGGINDVVEVMKSFLSDFDREVFCIVNLKTDGSVINMNIVSQGTLNSSIVSPREVFKSSILSNSASIIAFHNHPSGNVRPSREDYDTTKRLVECGEMLDIPLVDHVVVSAGGERIYSFLEHGELGKSYREVMRERDERDR